MVDTTGPAPAGLTAGAVRHDNDASSIVIGLGNPILSDDGVGVAVAAAVEQAIRDAPPGRFGGVTVTEASVGGLRLMEMLVGYRQAIIVDAMLPGPEAPPGSVRRLDLAELAQLCPTQHTASAHDTTLMTALSAGRLLGLSLPDEVVIVAIAAGRVQEFGEAMTAAVAAAVPRATATVLAILQRLPVP